MRHFISIADLTREQAVSVLATAEHMAGTQSRSIRKLPTLVGQTVVNLFFEDSTRTRIASRLPRSDCRPTSSTSRPRAPASPRASPSRTPR